MPDPGEELARRKEIWGLTRYLMAEHPLIRERFRFSYANPIPFEIEPGVRRVIKVEGGLNAAGRQEYWVLDGHGVTTTTELPDWASSVPEETYRPRTTGPSELVGRLEELRARFPEEDANLPPIGPAELAAWFGPTTEAEVLQKTTETLAGIVGISLGELVEVLASADASRAWADAALKRLVRSHTELRVTGAEAAELLAALLMIADAPRADRYLCLGTVGVITSAQEPLTATHDPVGSVEGMLGGGLDPAALIVPFASFGLYASSFAIEDVAESIALANLVAAKLREQGDETLDRCRDVTAVTLFFPLLAQALLWYLAAAEAFRFGDHFYRHMAPGATDRLRAIERELVLCEERRAVIGAALMRPAGLNGFNPDSGDLETLWGWALGLREMAVEDAELGVHEMALLLFIPRFVRDIGLGFVRLGAPQQFDAGVALLERTIARQKRDAPQHLRIGAETNYVAFAYDLLVFGAGKAGRTEERASFEAARAEWVEEVERLRRGHSEDFEVVP
jgi:hypothetical protein